MQSKFFCQEEANNYFIRNRNSKSFIADYILNIFGKDAVSTMRIAEFGIGNGCNLKLLSNYCSDVCGYDGSSLAIDNFKSYCDGFYGENQRVRAYKVNLCELINSEEKYDVIIFGFFAYYCTDDELLIVKQNALHMLKEGGYIFIYDFLSRDKKIKLDSRNINLRVYKRNMNFWLDYFENFDLIDFRLFDNRHLKKYLNVEKHTIDMAISADEDEWNFGALYRLRG